MINKKDLLREIREMVKANKVGPGADRYVGPFLLSGINCSTKMMLHITARKEGRADLFISLFPHQINKKTLEDTIQKCLEWESS